MAATVRTMIQSNDAGLQVTPIACDNTNGELYPIIQNGKSSKFVFYNPTGGSINVTLKAQNAAAVHVAGIGTVTPADKILAVAATKFGVFEVLAADLPAYVNTAGQVNFQYSATGLLAVGISAAT